MSYWALGLLNAELFASIHSAEGGIAVTGIFIVNA
jgi:hypothetical protein